MQIQLNTDRNIVGSEELASRVEIEVRASLGHFADRITRVEVHLNDLNSDKTGNDKRCMMEARIAGRQPMSVTHEAPTVAQSVDGASEKLLRALDRTFGKRDSELRSGVRQGNEGHG